MKDSIEIFHEFYYASGEVTKMNGFQRRRELKKQRILQTAIELFSTRGIKAVSIAEIAEMANVSQVSIYNFFGSKEELARQAIFTLTNEQMKWFETLVTSDGSFREKFESLVSENTQITGKYSEEFRHSIPWDDCVVRDFMDEYYQNRTIPLLMQLIEQGKKEGGVDSGLSNEAILLYIDLFKPLMAKKTIPITVRRDLKALFFYGLFGKPRNEE